MAPDVRALVVIEIDANLHRDTLATPAVGAWSDSRTPGGWELAARLTRREFAALADSLQIVPATATVDGHVAVIELPRAAYPGATRVSMRFDSDLLEPVR
jgi:hypothetical protein